MKITLRKEGELKKENDMGAAKKEGATSIRKDEVINHIYNDICNRSNLYKLFKQTYE